MPISSQSSLMMLLSKLAPQVTQELDQCSEDWDIALPHKLSNSFCSLIRGHMYAMMCFIKWSQKTKRFTTFGVWSNSIIVSMLVMSTCNNSKGVVTMMVPSGPWPKCLHVGLHCSQLLITFCIWAAMPGHQNQSFSKHSVCCWPWCPASWWHPFMAATQWALGTTNCKTSSSSPVGVWHDGKGLPSGALTSSALGE